MYVLWAEFLGIFLAEKFIEMLSRVGELVGARHKDGEVGQVDDAFDGGHLGGVDGLGHDVAHKQEAGLAVVDDIVYLLSVELMQDGHGDGSVGEGGQECHGPVSAVAAAYGNLVALFDAHLLEHDMQLFYLACHIIILQGDTFVVGQRIIVPVLHNAVLESLIEAFNEFHCTFLEILCKDNILFAHFKKKCAIFDAL